jgi:hypothetical protein
VVAVGGRIGNFRKFKSFFMKLKAGNVVKSLTSDKLMIINKVESIKPGFNSQFIGYLADNNDIDENEVYNYICFIEEDGLTKKLTFKRDELIFIRASY